MATYPMTAIWHPHKNRSAAVHPRSSLAHLHLGYHMITQVANYDHNLTMCPQSYYAFSDESMTPIRPVTTNDRQQLLIPCPSAFRAFLLVIPYFSSAFQTRRGVRLILVMMSKTREQQRPECVNNENHWGNHKDGY